MARRTQKTASDVSFNCSWKESPGPSFSLFLNSASLCFGFTVRQAFIASGSLSLQQQSEWERWPLLPGSPRSYRKALTTGHPRTGHVVEWCWESARALHPQGSFLHRCCRNNCSLYIQVLGGVMES